MSAPSCTHPAAKKEYQRADDGGTRVRCGRCGDFLLDLQIHNACTDFFCTERATMRLRRGAHLVTPIPYCDAHGQTRLDDGWTLVERIA